MEKPKFIIGIDPDVEKSGFALLNVENRTFSDVKAMTFSEVYHSLWRIAMHLNRMLGTIKPIGVIVVIEDSDSTTNWHIDKLEYASLNLKGKLRKAAAMGHGTGMCHATQRHIKEVAEDLKFEVVMQKPLKKTWQGTDGKITHEECMQFMQGLPKRTNSEMRDAALLAWNYANLPIHISASFYTQENMKKAALKEFKEKTVKEGEFLMKAGLNK